MQYAWCTQHVICPKLIPLWHSFFLKIAANLLPCHMAFVAIVNCHEHGGPSKQNDSTRAYFVEHFLSLSFHFSSFPIPPHSILHFLTPAPGLVFPARTISVTVTVTVMTMTFFAFWLFCRIHRPCPAAGSLWSRFHYCSRSTTFWRWVRPWHPSWQQRNFWSWWSTCMDQQRAD